MTALSLWQGFLRNFKWVCTGIATLVLAILSWLLARKNSKINQLQADLVFYKAKVQLQQLALKNDITMAELDKLQHLDFDLCAQIANVEKAVKEQIKDSMTAEEIAQRFREIGVVPRGE